MSFLRAIKIWIQNSLQSNLTFCYLKKWCNERVNNEIFGISKNSLLITCRSKDRNTLVLLNTNTQTSKEYKDIFIPAVSCVEMTEESPLNVFTCLTRTPILNQPPPKDPVSYQLTQLSASLETEELVFTKKIATSHSFTSLQSVGNGKFFLAKSLAQEECLLLVNKEKVEMIKVMARSMSPFGGFCTYVMMKNQFCLLEMDQKNLMSVNSLTIWKDKEKDHFKSLSLDFISKGL